MTNNRQEKDNKYIYLEQIRHLYANAVLGLLTTLINSLILVVVLWQVVEHARLLLWIGMLWGLTILRYVLIYRHRLAQTRDDYSASVWAKLFILAMALSGLSWGSVALIAFPAMDAEYQIFIAFVVGGMVAGASSSMHSLFKAVMAFNIIAMLPLVGRFVYEGSQIQYAMAVMLLLFLIMMLVFAHRGYEMFIATLNLRYEKNILQDDYHRTLHEAEQLTNHLQREVSDREMAEASLQQSELRLWSIIDHAPFVIYALDHEGQFILSEGLGLMAQGLKSGELVGKNFRKQMLAEPESIKNIERTLGGEKVSFIRQYQGCLLDVICTPLFGDKGTVIGVIGIETDVTEKLKMENIRRDLISTVSHELRTPLTSIVGSLILIKSGTLQVEQKEELIETALRNSQRLIRLVNDILDVDKLSSGKMVFQMTDHSLVDLLNQAVDANQNYADKLSVHLKFRQRISDMTINVDDERFLQVMANLVSNAIKYSPTDSAVEIDFKKVRKIETQDESEISKPYVEVSIVDHGPGIPLEHRATIFEKFTQVDAQISPVQGGTGLGLNIAKSIVEEMGGEIGFEVNEIEGWTRFFFLLPVVDVSKNTSQLESDGINRASQK
ncbi:MAG: ATP-binding protein [Gammaproteobacteria bacterium]|nr:ATP-binding protein [Gammaproteobacteria bacterium]